ncbi:MAG TPA: GTP-binding protein, partial [Chloroflexi bacterium]|nr:GTP-binding protein [Chloroflexota bacterium]
MNENYRIALAGNPNCGKTTIFNQLTGMNQHVGNWPGKTVEMKSGVCRFEDTTLDIIDLPGTYSLSAYSQEEIIARDYIIHEKPEVVVCVLDATNLERNLFLTAQIRELGVPVVVALNMADLLDANGMVIDTELLAKALGSPVIYTAANHADGLQELLETVTETARNNSGRPIPEPHPHHHRNGSQAAAPTNGLKHHARRHQHHHIAWRGARGKGHHPHHLNLPARQHMLAYT